jgi:[ribosomal protein S5]-alanine N-acetyltransferase
MASNISLTPRLQIEALDRTHAPALFEALQDPRIYTFVPTNPPASVELLEARYRMLEARTSPDGREAWLNWAVRWRDRNEYLGRIEATVREGGTASIAYEFAPGFWGKGIATEACQWLVEELVARYGVRELLAEVDTRNTPSIRLLERLGFDRVGSRENADWFKGATSHEHTYRRRAAAGG